MSELSDILFPSQEAAANNNINRILGDLKRSNLTITNRLKSIQQDADFVEEVGAAFGGKRPLVANERCGSWYIRPAAKGGSAYFKSTDGHTGQWKFSTRRLNLHLLPLIEKCDGIIVVDSTRRGKRMPDALSKTIPIWCCVLNRALFPDRPEYHDIHVPPNAVSDSEKSQMLSRIPEGLEGLKQLKLDLAGLRAQISRPLRPTWVTQETDLSHYHMQADEDKDEEGGAGVRIFEEYRPVICCTSSKRMTGGEMSGHTGYIQGAGDDTENWAHGLTPPVFWEHADQFLSTPEADLPDLIKSLVASANHPPSFTSSSTTNSNNNNDLPPTVRQLTPHLYVSPLPIPQTLPEQDRDTNTNITWCRIALLSTVTPPETWRQSPTHLAVGLGRHKVASRNLRLALADICEFATRFLLNNNGDDDDDNNHRQKGGQGQEKRILIACETGGRDLSVGLALALLCWCFTDDEGVVMRGRGKKDRVAGEQNINDNNGGEGDEKECMPSFNKTMIKIRLGRIMTVMPDANPNRATLQSVNSFLMDWRK